MKIGDYVTRKKYNHDIVFKIIQIKEIKNSYKSYGKYLGKIRNTVNKLSA